MKNTTPDLSSLSAGYTLAAEELLDHLGVDPREGLNTARVADMRSRFGANTLPEPKRKSKVLLFLEQFNNPLIYILFAAAILTSIVADPAEAITIFVVVIFNAIIGFVQEQKASERLKAVMGLTAPSARVVRSGAQQSILAEELVVGDIVLLESGVRVPADLRLIEATDLTVDESMLTGESLPVVKNAGRVLSQRNTPLGDRVNMAFSGTTVRKGRGRGLVLGIGEFSEVGKITKGVAAADETVSPLQERLEQFGKIMAIGIAIIIGTIFVVGLLRGYDKTQMLLTSIGLAVSAIPEGLPIAVTVALSIGVFQMARRNAIVRKMRAVETLGSTTVICSDKTGTLTRNQMTTVAIATDDRIFRFTGGGYDPVGNLLDDAGHRCLPEDGSSLMWTLQIGLLCTESSFSVGENGERVLVGDPTEGAMIVAAEKGGVAERLRGVRTEVVLPFESERMYMVVRLDVADKSWYLVKGSVERVLAMCDRELRDEGIRPLDEHWIHERQEQFSGNGLRVIATAFLEAPSGTSVDPAALVGCTFSGLQGIEDPPRAEVGEAITEAHRAGIKVVMITGDHVATAVSIAEQLDIRSGREVRPIPGTMLEEMSDEDLFERVATTDVYARVAPEHKLRIVRQLQRHQHVVAMTGDGVNDAPALKQADIGIAMGSGTDVAKEASSLVVQDDNFATIVSAIRYGRLMFRNLQHMVLYVLSTSIGGMMTLTAAVILGFPLPVLAVQLLWINLVTDGTSTIPLAYEKEHDDIMVDPPRRRSEGLLNMRMAERIMGSGLIMMFGTLMVFEIILGNRGFTAFSADVPADVMTYARTAAFTTLALFQIWNVHNSRALDHSIFKVGLFSNKPLMAVTVLALLLQVAAVELPFMHRLMKTTHLDWHDWVLCVGTSVALIVLVELRKWLGHVFASKRP